MAKRKALLIAEKPSLMEAIRAGYKSDVANMPYEITFLAQAGHLYGLMQPKEIDAHDKTSDFSWKLDKLPYEFDGRYRLKVTSPAAQKHITEIKNALKSGDYDVVINAGDPDQEGEILIRETLYQLGWKGETLRFWSNDITVGACAAALKHMKPDSEYDNLYYAALTRQRADYNMGMNFTTVATLKYGGSGNVMNVGRVKAAIIRVLVDRELAIRNFVEKTSYKKAFMYKGAEFVCDKEFETAEKATLNPAPDHATVLEYKSGTKSTKAPALFKLSSLQTEASKAYHYSANKTLEIAQSLYEKKVISYPRSTCEYLFATTDYDKIRKATAKIVGLDESLFVKSSDEIKADKAYTNEKAAAKEGHTAIIPTGESASLSSDEKNLYDLIARRFLAIFCANKKTHVVSAKAVENDDVKGDVYAYSASEVIDKGFEVVLYPDKKPKEEVILTLKNGEKLTPIEFKVKECTTKPPARFNDGSLMKYLDNPEEVKDDDDHKIKYQIGTPATRANILEQVIKADFAKRDKSGALYATPKAEQIVDEIGDTPLFNVRTSGLWELELIKIRNGEVNYREVMDRLHKECETITNDIKQRTPKNKVAGASAGGAGGESLGTCPKCGNNITYGKFGAYCTGKCGASLAKVMGHQLTAAEAKKFYSGKPILIKNIQKKNGSGTYDANFTFTGEFTESQYNGKTYLFPKTEMSFPNKK